MLTLVIEDPWIGRIAVIGFFWLAIIVVGRVVNKLLNIDWGLHDD